MIQKSHTKKLPTSEIVKMVYGNDIDTSIEKMYLGLDCGVISYRQDYSAYNALLLPLLLLAPYTPFRNVQQYVERTPIPPSCSFFGNDPICEPPTTLTTQTDKEELEELPSEDSSEGSSEDSSTEEISHLIGGVDEENVLGVPRVEPQYKILPTKDKVAKENRFQKHILHQQQFELRGGNKKYHKELNEENEFEASHVEPQYKILPTKDKVAEKYGFQKCLPKKVQTTARILTGGVNQNNSLIVFLSDGSCTHSSIKQLPKFPSNMTPHSTKHRHFKKHLKRRTNTDVDEPSIPGAPTPQPIFLE
jgi:hypothetical protein